MKLFWKNVITRLPISPKITHTRQLPPPVKLEQSSVFDWLEHRRLQLGLIIGSFVWLFLLLTKVSPSKVADIGLTATYIPLLIPTTILSYSVARLVLARRFAIYIALAAFVGVFCQVHSVQIPPTYIVFPLVVLLLIELIYLLAKKH